MPCSVTLIMISIHHRHHYHERHFIANKTKLDDVSFVLFMKLCRYCCHYYADRVQRKA